MRKLSILLTLVGAIALGWYFWDLRSDQSKSIKVLRSTPLYSEPETMSGTPSIGVVDPGEKLRVRRIRYGKNFMNVKVEKENGITGWIIFQSDHVELGEH